MTPTDDDIRMLLETYRFCRKFAHAGQVGTNAVTLISALEELLNRRKEQASLLHTIAQLEQNDSAMRAVPCHAKCKGVPSRSSGPESDQEDPSQDPS